jgi:archaellum component FlaF (FlaF/FlaG flagellin family)
MADYSYKTIIYKDTTSVVGLNVTQNNAALASYESTHQADTVKVDGMVAGQLTYQVDKTPVEFNGLIVTPHTWADVREISKPDRYELYLITSTPL